MKRPSSSLPYSALRVRAEAADAAPVKTKNFSIFLPTHCCVLAASALTRLRISAASANGLISTILSAAMSGRPGTHLSCSSSVATGASFTATQPCCKTMTVCKKATTPFFFFFVCVRSCEIDGRTESPMTMHTAYKTTPVSVTSPLPGHTQGSLAGEEWRTTTRNTPYACSSARQSRV